jgi:hypothetical protein
MPKACRLTLQIRQVSRRARSTKLPSPIRPPQLAACFISNQDGIAADRAAFCHANRLCLSQIKSGHIGGVARRELGGKKCAWLVRRRGRSAHLSPKIEADIAVDDRARGAGQQFGERRSDHFQFVVGRRRAPGVGADHRSMVVLRRLHASSLKIGKAVDQASRAFDDEHGKLAVAHRFGTRRREPSDRLARDPQCLASPGISPAIQGPAATMTFSAKVSSCGVVMRMPAAVGRTRAAALTMRSSAPSRKARIAASANRMPPVSCTTTSQSSGSRNAGNAALVRLLSSARRCRP